MNKHPETYTIGQIAQKTGLTPKMIRDYEHYGLLKTVARSENGYRIFTQQHLHTLYFISEARKLGFSLAQLKELLQLWSNKQRSSAEVKALAMQHIHALEKRAHTLLEMATTLRTLSEQCHGDDRPECPILQRLEKKTAASSH